MSDLMRRDAVGLAAASIREQKDRQGSGCLVTMRGCASTEEVSEMRERCFCISSSSSSCEAWDKSERCFS
eukprot:463729-Rhodomonas_salina.2